MDTGTRDQRTADGVVGELTEPTHDPVHGASFAFARWGEDELLVETRLEPGGVLPEHSHPRQLEIWWVLEGEAEFKLDGRRRRVGPDDGQIRIEPGMRHALRNRGSQPVFARATASPPLGLQSFLERTSEAARAGHFHRGGIPTRPSSLLWMAKLLDAYREDVVISFPPPWLQRLALLPLLALARRRG